jgi:hypothetical protein
LRESGDVGICRIQDASRPMPTPRRPAVRLSRAPPWCYETPGDGPDGILLNPPVPAGAGVPRYQPPPSQPSILGPFLRPCPEPSGHQLRALRALGYTGSYTLLKAAVQSLRGGGARRGSKRARTKPATERADKQCSWQARAQACRPRGPGSGRRGTRGTAIFGNRGDSGPPARTRSWRRLAIAGGGDAARAGGGGRIQDPSRAA